MEGDGAASGVVHQAHQLAPMALPWRRSACLGFVPVSPYLGGRRRGQPVGDGGGAHAGGPQGCDCRCWASGRQGQGVGQALGNFHGRRGLLQERASQHHHGVLNCSVCPLGQPPVHGGPSVSGDVDQMHGAEVWKAWPGRQPGTWRSCHGDDRPRPLELTAEVFGADPADWRWQGQLWPP